MTRIPKISVPPAPSGYPACGRCGTPYTHTGFLRQERDPGYSIGAPIRYWYDFTPTCRCYLNDTHPESES